MGAFGYVCWWRFGHYPDSTSNPSRLPHWRGPHPRVAPSSDDALVAFQKDGNYGMVVMYDSRTRGRAVIGYAITVVRGEPMELGALDPDGLPGALIA